MSADVTISIAADASLLNKGLEEAAAEIRKLADGANVTGQNLRQSLEIGIQAQKALRDQIALTEGKQRQANESYRKAAEAFRESSRTIAQIKKEHASLTAEQKKSEAEQKKYNAALAKENENLKKLSQTLTGARVERQKVREQLIGYRNAVTSVDVSVRRLTQEQRALEVENTQLASSFNSVKGFANQLAGVFGFGFGLYGGLMLFKDAAATVVEFDSKIRTLAAISGASAKELGELSTLAIQVGSSSKYGAGGIAEMMTELSKMGFANDEISNMAYSISKLATAAHEELAPATETVANMIRAFGLDSKDTGEIVDTMAYSFVKSALDLSKFRESMKYIAPVAKQANFSIKDTSALLAKLSDAGISGSLAGTSLRTVIGELSDSSSELTKRIGFAVSDFDDFVKALEMMKEQGSELEDVFKVIDKRAASAFTVLLDGTKDLKAFRASLDDVNGAAAEMARVQMQSISNQTKLAASAWDGFILAIDKGDGFISELAKGALSIFSNTLNSITMQMTRQSKQMEEDIQILENWERALTNSNNTVKDRQNILKALKDEYPEMFANMDTEKAKWEDITGAVSEALRLKRTYLDLQFNNEEIEQQNKLIEQAKDLYSLLSKEVQKFMLLDRESPMFKEAVENLEKANAIIANDFTREFALMNMTIEGTNITLGEFKAALDIEKRVAGLTKEISNLSDANAILAAITLDATDAIEKDETVREKVGVVSEEITEKFKLQAKAAIYAGKTIKEAYGTAFETLTDKYTEQLKVLQEREVALKAEMEAQRGVVDRTEEQEESLNKTIIAYRKTGLQIEAIKLALTSLQESYDEAINANKRELRETENLLRLEQKIAETKARINLDDIALEERLSDIKLYYANQIAKVTLTGEELRKTIHLNQLEREEELQRIEQNRIKQRMSLEESAHKRKIDLMTTEQELAKIEVSGVGKSAVERNVSREMQLQYLAYSYEQDLRILSTQNEIKRLDEEWNIKKASYKQGTGEYIRLHEEYLKQKAFLEEKSNQENDNATMAHLAKMAELDQKLHNARITYLKSEQAIEKQKNDWNRENALFETSRVTGLLDALDILGARTQRIREQEKKNNADELKEQKESLEVLRQKTILRIAELKAAREIATPAEIPTIDANIEEAQNSINQLDFDIQKTQILLDRILSPDLSTEEWNNVISSMKTVKDKLVDIYQGILDERYRIAQEERELLDNRVSELQKDLEIELKLNEQGFASNVQTLMNTLAEQKKARDKAIVEEKKAAEEQRRIEKIIQTVNLLTAVSNVIKSGSKLGLPGILASIGGVAGLWALWGNSIGKSKSATTYEHGGSFMLRGKSHAQGGELLAPGHEAQGGEMVSVFSRSATKKYAPEIKSMTDIFNSGKLDKNGQGDNYNFDSTDVKAIRKILEKDNVTYANGYKIIKKGNTTIRCRLN